MPRKIFNIKEDIGELNKIREAYNMADKVFSRKELSKLLKSVNFPYDENFLTIFTRSKHVIRIKRGLYKFDTEPIPYVNIEKIYNYCLNMRKQKSNSKQESMSIEKAIALLKENGYKIYKSVTTYEEVLFLVDSKIPKIFNILGIFVFNINFTNYKENLSNNNN